MEKKYCIYYIFILILIFSFSLKRFILRLTRKPPSKNDRQKKLEKRKKKAAKEVSQPTKTQTSTVKSQEKTNSDKNEKKDLVRLNDSNASTPYASVVNSNLPQTNQTNNYNDTDLPIITVTFHVYVPPFLLNLNTENCQFSIFGEFNNWDPDKMKKLKIVKNFKEGLILSNTFEFKQRYQMEYKYLLKYKNSENEIAFLVEYLGSFNENRRLYLNTKSNPFLL